MGIKQFLYLSLATFVIGILLFAWRNEWIIIHVPALFHPAGEKGIAVNKQAIKVSYYKQENWHTENAETIWEHGADAKNSARVAGAYFTLLYEEALTEQKIDIEAAATDQKDTTLYVSLTHNPLPTEATVKEKLMIVEGLLRTLREAVPALNKVVLLVHHQPLTDYHLDFAQPWPIEGFLSTPAQTSSVILQQSDTQKYTLLLDPTGDAQYTGRTIDDTFERGVSLQIAQELKHALEESHPEIRVMLTRIPGETVEPLQNATFANRLPANLFVPIGIVAHTKPLPAIATYVMNGNPSFITASAASRPLSFEPYTNAHEQISPVSFTQAQLFVRALKQQGSDMPATILSPLALPFHPLVGICVPAFGIEIAVKNMQELKALVVPLARALGQLSAPTI